MSEDSKTWWDKTKAWANRNPTLAGAAAGFAAGSVVPGVGNVVGAVGGAVVGHMAGRDKKVEDDKNSE